MSLSFVASAVQTGTTDGGFEETPIESKQVDAVNKRNAHKPLFEQLRENQDEEQAKQEEMQREMMRGTRALDEEDVAHLDALEKQRLEREREVQQRTQDELAMFRAAKAEQQQVSLEDDVESDVEVDPVQVPRPPPVAETRPSAPKIVVKKRKRRKDGAASGETEKTKKQKDSSSGNTEGSEEKKDTKEPTEAPAGLGGLLAGYGSSDDSD